MGGFAAGFAGGLQGAGQEIQQRNLFNLVQDVNQKNALAQSFEHLAQDPNVRPEAQQLFQQGAMQIRTLKPGQNHAKLVSELMNKAATMHFAPILTPPPGQPQAAQVPQGPQAASDMENAGILAPQNIQANAAQVAAQPIPPPPTFRYSLPEQIQMSLSQMMAAGVIKGQGEADAIGRKSAELVARGMDPKIAPYIAAGHEPPKPLEFGAYQGLASPTGEVLRQPTPPPVSLAPGAQLIQPPAQAQPGGPVVTAPTNPPPPGAPPSGNVIASSAPILPADILKLNGAVRSVAKNLGIQLNEADARNLISQLPPDAQLMATKLAKDTEESTSLQMAREANLQMRKLMQPLILATAQAREQNVSAARSDASFNRSSTQLEQIRKPIDDAVARLGRLQDTINQETPQADALVAPELLSVMAGGQGSGVRMNEAEISRIVGGRTHLESLKAALNKWQVDPNKGLSVTPAQRKQIRDLVKTVNDKLTAKQKALDEAGDGLLNTGEVNEHRRIVSDARKKLTSIDQGTAAATPAGGPSGGGGYSPGNPYAPNQ